MTVFVTVVVFCMMGEPCQYYAGDKPYSDKQECIAAAEQLRDHFVLELRKDAIKAGYSIMPPMKAGYGCKDRDSV